MRLSPGDLFYYELLAAYFSAKTRCAIICAYYATNIACYGSSRYRARGGSMTVYIVEASIHTGKHLGAWVSMIAVH